MLKTLKLIVNNSAIPDVQRVEMFNIVQNKYSLEKAVFLTFKLFDHLHHLARQ